MAHGVSTESSTSAVILIVIGVLMVTAITVTVGDTADDIYNNSCGEICYDDEDSSAYYESSADGGR